MLKNDYRDVYVQGFTLIELIIVIALLGALFVIALSTLNPKLQLDRAADARRKENLFAIHNGLDAYYGDHQHYPNCISQQEGFTKAYMQKIPSDRLCDEGKSCFNYLYVTNPQNPQWFILFAKLATSFGGATPCVYTCPSLPNTSFCQYQEVSSSEYNYCITGGTVDTTVCPYVVDVTPTPTLANVPTSTPQATSTLNLTPTPTPIPTVTPYPTLPPCPGGYYYCSCGNNNVTVCNVTFTEPSGFSYWCDPVCSNQCGKSC